MGNLLNQMGLLIRFRFLGLEDTQQNVPAGFHVYRYHDTHSPVKVVPTYMHGQGPCDKCRLLSCLTNTLSVARSSHIYIDNTWCGTVWVPSTVTRMCRMAPKVLHNPQTIHQRRICAPYKTIDRLDRYQPDSMLFFNMFLQPNKLLACVHFITYSTRVSDILRFIIHTPYLNDKFTKFGHQRTPDAPSIEEN